MDNTEELELPGLSYSHRFHDESLSSKILDGLNDLRLAQKFFDMTLCVGEHSFMCHRVVLASASDYFRSMFGGMMRESFTDQVTIFDVDANIMDLLIQFCYTGQVEINIENVERLLKAADLFQFPSIKDECCEFLAHNLHPSNSLNIEKFADKMSCNKLARISFEYTLHHIVEVTQVPDFVNLDVEKILQIISHPNLYIDKEEHAYEITLYWIKADMNSRMQYFDRLMEHIRFPFMRRIYLLAKVEMNALMKNSVFCQRIIKQTRGFHNCELDRHEHPSTRMQPRPSTGIAEVLVMLGGCDNNCDEIISTSCLNPLTGHCRVLAEGPEGLRGGFSCVVLDNDIFVTGGSDGFQMFANVWRYKSQLNEWVEIAPMIQPREYHASVAINTLLYVISAEGCEKYDLLLNTWNEMPSMPYPVNNCSVAACLGKIYAIGSVVIGNNIMMQVYDPKIESWSVMESDFSNICQSAFVPSITALGGKLYFIHEDSNQVIAYDPADDVWLHRVQPMLQLHLGGCITQFGGKIVASGGYDQRFGLSEMMEAYDPARNEWQYFGKLPRPMFWHNCVSVFRYVSAPRGDYFHAPLSLHNFSEVDKNDRGQRMSVENIL